MNELVSFQQNPNLEKSLTTNIHTDDTTLISARSEKLKLSWEKLEKSCLKWSTKLNVQKYKIITDDDDDDNININDIIVEKVNELVFVGSVILENLSDVRRRIALLSLSSLR